MDVEKTVIYFLKQLHPNKHIGKTIIKVMKEVRKYVPYELGISGSCFTHMSIIGKLDTNGDIPPHHDKKPALNIIVIQPLLKRER